MTSLTDELKDHLDFDSCVICEACLNALSDAVQTPTAVRDEMDLWARDCFEEMFDFETGLTEYAHRSYKFSNWFSYFPFRAELRLNYSLTLGELFSRGFRMRGRIKIGRPEFEEFVDRFSTGQSEATVDFLEHFHHALECVDQFNAAPLAGVRATVSCLTVERLMSSSRSVSSFGFIAAHA